jgi:hypothetical protein
VRDAVLHVVDERARPDDEAAFISVSWRASAAGICSGCRSHNWVLDSTSVNRKARAEPSSSMSRMIATRRADDPRRASARRHGAWRPAAAAHLGVVDVDRERAHRRIQSAATGIEECVHGG